MVDVTTGAAETDDPEMNRTALGLFLVMAGAVLCLTIIGAVIGLPMILYGGYVLYTRKRE